jgi:hypothetical protein
MLLLQLLAQTIPGAAEPPTQEIETLVHTVMVDGRLDFPLAELAARATNLQTQLVAWRANRADDLEGILSQAKIVWLLDRLQPQVASSDAAAAGSPGNQMAQQELQRAATRYPGNAAIHFWRAQLFASPVVRTIDGHLTARPIDRPRAIEEAQRAWDLDAQKQAHYRDALATFLAEDFRDAEALALLQDHQGNDSPLGTLMQDLRAIPLPDGTLLLEKDSRRFAEDQLARGRISDALYVRARVYLLPNDAQQFETLCRQQWPDFRLLTAQDTKPGPSWRSHAMQVLLLGGGAPRPIADLDQLDVAAMDGIALTLIELRDPPNEQRRQSPAGAALPMDLGDVYVYLYVLNDRTIH